MVGCNSRFNKPHVCLGSNPSAVTCLCIILTKYEWN
nr:MAG TPA: hypothetical protein [Caudoviricetes sp.]